MTAAEQVLQLVSGAASQALADLRPTLEALLVPAPSPSPTPPDLDELRGVNELARSVKRSGQWLRNLIDAGCGPPIVQLGGRYRQASDG